MILGEQRPFPVRESARVQPVSRDVWVDSAKGFAICLVVLGHVSRGLFAAGLYTNVMVFQHLDDFLYSFHVPLFFFLSGLFLQRSLKKNGLKGLLVNRTRTILYPYILWSVLQGVVEHAMGHYTNTVLTLPAVFSLWIPRAQFWFLYALFLVTVATGLLLTVSTRVTYIFFVTLLSLLLYLSVAYLPINPISQSIAPNLFFMILGILAAALGIFDREVTVIQSLLAAALYIYIFWRVGFTLADGGQALRAALAVAAIIAVVGIFSRMKHSYNRALSYFGRFSLEIYLLHILAAAGSRVLLIHLFGVTNIVCHLIIDTLVGVGAPLFIVIVARSLHANFLFVAPWRAPARLLQ